MDWIKVEKSTPRKPEVLMIARELGIHPDHAFGLCVRFWMWCDTHLASGKLHGVDCDMLDAILEKNGAAAALKKVGWIEFSGDMLRVSNFGKHMSENAKVRASNNLRQTNRRENVSRSKRDKNVTKALPEIEKEIEEDKDIRTPPTPSQAIPIPDPVTDLATAEPMGPEGELAHAWTFMRAGTGWRVPAGETLPELLEFFREKLRIGKDPQRILAAIENPARDRTEKLWQFSRRELEEPAKGRAGEWKSTEQVMAEMMDTPEQRRALEIAFNGWNN